MTLVADRIVAGARACIGTRFRPQGRAVASGLDCVGVVLLALRAAGYEVQPPASYRIEQRGLTEVVNASLRAARLTALPVPSVASGAICVFEPMPGLTHLAVATGRRIVHAHLGLGRVVEGPPEPTWQLRSAWCAAGEEI